MASRTRGVGNDPAIANFSAPARSVNGGVPNRVGFAGARGFRSAGFGGTETGPDGNLQPAIEGAQPEPATTSTATAPITLSSAGAPRPSTARSLLGMAGTRAAGALLKRGVGAMRLNAGGQGELDSFMTGLPEATRLGAGLDPSAAGDARDFPVFESGEAGPAAGDAADFPEFEPASEVEVSAATGVPQFSGEALEGAEYTFTGWRDSGGVGDGPRTQYQDQWGNDYWTDDGGSVLEATGPSFGEAVGSGLDAGGFAGDALDFPAFEAGDALGAAGDAAGGFDIGGYPIGAGLKLLQGDVGGAAKSAAGFFIGNAIFPGIGGAIGGFLANACFITEAVMAAGGAGDNAEELQILRYFRDNVMMTTPEGQAMVQEYEALAPAVVEAIGSRPDGMQIFQQIYSEFIVPAVEAIRAGNMKGALEIYTQMIGQVTPFATEMMGEEEGGMIDDMGSHAAMMAHGDEMGADVTGGMGAGNADWAPPTGANPMQPQMPMQPGMQALAPGAGPPPRRPAIGGFQAQPRRY